MGVDASAIEDLASIPRCQGDTGAQADRAIAEIIISTKAGFRFVDITAYPLLLSSEQGVDQRF